MDDGEKKKMDKKQHPPLPLENCTKGRGCCQNGLTKSSPTRAQKPPSRPKKS